MRQILFRGKRIDNGEWIEGFYVLCRGHHYILQSCDIDHGFDERYCYWIEIDIQTLCQSIGLTDKNNVRIFENDIILAGFYKWKCKVVWDNENARFICYTNDKDVKIVYVGMVDKDNKSALEVIGNIFDNPELMKGGDKTENRS